MVRFDFLSPYKVSNGTQGKHTFYPLNESDIKAAEERLGRRFPEELRTFFLEIGYGFLCNDDKSGVDRFMDPDSLVDFVLGVGTHKGDLDRVMYDDPHFLPFFEVGEGVYLTLALDEVSSDGACPVYYFETKVADSILDFVTKMDQETDYFIDL